MAHLTIQDLFHPFEQLPAESCLGPPELPANQGMLVSFVGPNGNVDMEPLRIHIDASVFELRVRICVVRKCSMENVQLLVGSTMLNDHDTLEQFNGSESGGNMTMTLIVGQDQVVSLLMAIAATSSTRIPRRPHARTVIGSGLHATSQYQGCSAFKKQAMPVCS